MMPSLSLAAILERCRTHHSWYNKSYSGYYAGIHLQGLAVAEEAKSPWGVGYGFLFQNYKDKNHFDWFWDAEALKERRETFLFMAKMNTPQVEVILQEGEANHERFLRYVESFAGMDLMGCSDKELKEHFSGLKDELVAVSQWSYSVDSFLSDSGEDWLEAFIKETLKDKATSEVIAVLTLPVFSSFVNDAEILFLRIVFALKMADEALAQELSAEYQQRYFWIRTNYLVYERVSKEQILKEARDWLRVHAHEDVALKISHEEQRIKEHVEAKRALFESLPVSQELRSVLRLSEVFTHLQDLRKERVLRMNCLFYPFIQEMERRFGIEHPLGFYVTMDELFCLFEGVSVDWMRVRSRYEQGFLTIFSQEGVKVFSYEEFKAQGLDATFFPALEVVQEIKGTTAYRGIVKGVVRVLKNVTDIAAFQAGEILVANQTTPEYVPAMKKAIAMITDQGGITCHAAIVSRELEIPTVIGTKVATQVLKTGDMVEVDANTGIVRCLS